MKAFDNPNALAAIGTYQFRSRKSFSQKTSTVVVRKIISNVVPSDDVRIRINPQSISTLTLADNQLAELEGVWIETIPAAPRISVGIDAYHSNKILHVKKQLSAATGIDSVFIADRSLNKNINWSWPMRVGFLPDDDSQLLKSISADLYKRTHLFKPVTIGNHSDICDLLIVPSIQHLGMLSYINRVGVLLIMSHEDQPSSFIDVRIKARKFQAGAIGVINNADKLDLHSFFHTFMDSFTHDQPLDRILSHTLGGPEKFLLTSHPTFLKSFRISRQPSMLIKKAKRALDLNLIGKKTYAKTTSYIKTFKKHADAAGYDSEMAAATTMATEIRKVEDVMDRVSASEELRFLQAQVYEVIESDISLRNYSFRSEAQHQIKIRIGPGSIDWMCLQTPFPEEELDDEQEFHKLSILLRSEHIEGSTQEKDIMVPNIGSSTEAIFNVNIIPRISIVQINVILFYKNKPIQYGLITGPISSSSKEVKIIPGIELNVCEPANFDLSHCSESDITFYNTESNLIVRSKNKKNWEVSLSDIDKFMEDVSDSLFKASKLSYIEPQSIFKDEGLLFLQKVASHGEYLRRNIFEGVPPQELESFKTVHVESPCSSIHFPVEFLYDGSPVKDDAKLCNKFSKSDDCKNSCDIHRSYSKEKLDIICPHGFWGLKRIIERQLRKFIKKKNFHSNIAPEARKENHILPKINELVFAASDRINTTDRPDMINDTITDLDEIIKASPLIAKTWEEWKAHVKSNKPPLLLALPHNEKTNLNFEALEIGKDDLLQLNLINSNHVRSSDSDIYPIFLLFGCNTASSEIGFEDFIAEIRKQGAAIVVGTISKVLGRQAAPLSVEFVRLLDELTTSTPVRFGELMKNFRHQALHNGNLMALSIVAYGDSTWEYKSKGVTENA